MATIMTLLNEAQLPDSPSARLDAELLLAAALGKPRSFLRTWPERVVSREAHDLFDRYLARRLAGEPVAYILGRQGFWSLDLEVAPHTLIPRQTPNCWWRPRWRCCRPRLPACSTWAPALAPSPSRWPVSA